MVVGEFLATFVAMEHLETAKLIPSGGPTAEHGCKSSMIFTDWCVHLHQCIGNFLFATFDYQSGTSCFFFVARYLRLSLLKVFVFHVPVYSMIWEPSNALYCIPALFNGPLELRIVSYYQPLIPLTNTYPKKTQGLLFLGLLNQLLYSNPRLNWIHIWEHLILFWVLKMTRNYDRHRN